MPDLGLTSTIAPTTLAAIIGIGIVAVGLAPVLLAPRLRRIDVSSTIRVVE